MCFLGGDQDSDGNRDLSNIVVAYNHISSNFANATVVMKGQSLGQTITSFDNGNLHLHFEVFIASGFKRENIRINPLFMFNTALVTDFLYMSGSPCDRIVELAPYFPIVRYKRDGDLCVTTYLKDADTFGAISETTDINESISLFGLLEGDVASLSFQASLKDKNAGSTNFEDIQIPIPVSEVEYWPMGDIPRLIPNMVQFFTDYTFYSTQSFPATNCVGIAISTPIANQVGASCSQLPDIIQSTGEPVFTPTPAS